MREKAWGIALAVSAVLAWAALAYIVLEMSPEPLLTRIVFFLGVFAALALSTAAVAYFLSFRLQAMRRNQGDVRRAGLQGLPPAVVITVIAGLQSVRLLNLSLVLILLIGAVVVELALWPWERTMPSGGGSG